MKLTKILAILFIGIFVMMPILSNAFVTKESYTYSGRAYVPKKYRNVGKVPEKIVIKTNKPWDKCIFQQAGLKVGGLVLKAGVVYPQQMTIKIYRYFPAFKGYILIKQRTYKNAYMKNNVFDMRFGTYSKYWYAPWVKYLKITFTIPKRKALMFRWTGKYKIVIEGVYKGSYYKQETDQMVDLTVYIKGKTKPFEVKGSPYVSVLNYWSDNSTLITTLSNAVSQYNTPVPSNAIVYGIDTENGTLYYTQYATTSENDNDSILMILITTVIVGLIAVVYVFKKK